MTYLISDAAKQVQAIHINRDTMTVVNRLGIGGVKAPSIFFLRDRVETSFMNRIKTMCSYFFEQM